MSAVRNRPRPPVRRRGPGAISGAPPSSWPAGVRAARAAAARGRVLQRRAGAHAVGARESAPVPVGADEGRELVVAPPQLLPLGLFVLAPARRGGACDPAPAGVVAEAVEGLDRPGEALQQGRQLGPDLMQFPLTGEEVTGEIIGRSHSPMILLFDFGWRDTGGSAARFTRS